MNCGLMEFLILDIEGYSTIYFSYMRVLNKLLEHDFLKNQAWLRAFQIAKMDLMILEMFSTFDIQAQF